MDRALSHPILDCAEARVWETQRLKDEAAEWQAMLHAGSALAGAIAGDFREIGGWPEAAHILVLAGKGHNGGDALLAAREILLARPKSRAAVVLPFGRAALRPLAARALEWLLRDAPGRADLAGANQALAREARYALCLDGIFGFQFRAPMDASAADLIAATNRHPGIAFRAAVDLPSGIGESHASTVCRADFTYATGIVKRPLLSPQVAAAVGRLRYLDLGFFDAGEPPADRDRVLTASVLSSLAGFRAAQSDKRTFGHLLVVGGSRSYPGAVVMAVRAALRSGAGLVTAFVPAALAPEYAARHPEAMWVGSPETPVGGLEKGTAELIRDRLPRATAMLIGPGLGAEAEVLGWVAELVTEIAVPVVLDADALRTEVVTAAIGKPFIATPHAGEYGRIAPALAPGDGVEATGGVLVLKGPLTRVTDGYTSYLSPFGGPVLARGGSGDLLAGLIGGLLAQGPADPLLAACRGTVWHGRAADLLARTRGQVAVEISEILEQLGPALLL